MWQAFELIHKSFKAGAELYLEDMLPALQNFVSFGIPHLVQSPEYVNALYSMVADLFDEVKLGNIDRICACKLAESMMLHLRGQIDPHVRGFVGIAMGVLGPPQATEGMAKTYRIHLMEMVINAIYYNPMLTLTALEEGGWTNRFFSLWFSSMDMFRRVHDKKLCIVGIAALLNVAPEQIPPSVSVGWPRLLQAMVVLFKTLPQALKSELTISPQNEAISTD
jgi:importin-7